MFKKRSRLFLLLLSLLLLMLMGCNSAVEESPVNVGDVGQQEQQEPLPDYITIASYDVGSNTFSQAAALGEGILKKTGLKTRQIVAGTDFGRIIPVRSGKVHFFLGSSNTIQLAKTGRAQFEAMEWGPQPFRQIWCTMSATGIGLMTPGNSDIEKVSDLKGKRYPFVVGNDSANFANEAILRFGGLTWDDVKIVEVPGTSEVYQALLNGQIDAAGGTVVAPPFYEMAETSRGIKQIPFPKEDTVGWDAIRKFAPNFVPFTAKIGAGISEDNPVELLGFSAPLVLTYAELDENIAYTMTKAINESYDSYKDLNPDLVSWAIDKSILPEIIICPFHDGAIKYFKEIGWWNDELQKKQDELLAEEEKALRLWDKTVNEFIESGKPSKDFIEVWRKNRDASF
ncbi:MAG: TAXI family TRAP transporter solute-binding subunit [Clostridiaceae bacterium]|nr:TAXI family TRAP transporter solute-binding subunit [Clostridiaceae bacterium]